MKFDPTDPDPGDLLIAALNQWRDEGDPRPFWEYLGMPFDDYLKRCANVPDDVDGEPDSIPATDNDPVTEVSK